MAKSSNNDNDNNDEKDDESFHKKGLIILNVLPKNKNAHAIFSEIMET